MEEIKNIYLSIYLSIFSRSASDESFNQFLGHIIFLLKEKNGLNVPVFFSRRLM